MGSKPVVFHSGDIGDTKAREKREVFVKVEEKKTLKQSAEEFQKKFAEAKAHAAESRAKIENPGADENGVIRSRVHFQISTKTLMKILIPLIIVSGGALAIYLNWGTIYHEFFEVSEARALELLESNPERAATIFEQVIQKETNLEKKENKSIWYAYKLLSTCSGEDDSSCSEKLLEKVYNLATIAEEISPSQFSAEYLATYYSLVGNQAESERWANIVTSRREEAGEEVLGEG